MSSCSRGLKSQSQTPAPDLCAEWNRALEQLGITHLSQRLDDLAGERPHSFLPDPIRRPFKEATREVRSTVARGREETFKKLELNGRLPQ